MSLIPMKLLLEKAKENKYAVGQFNIVHFESFQAIGETAKEEQSPIIFGVGEKAIQYLGMKQIVSLANVTKEIMQVPISLHLDHGSSFEMTMKCIQAGFSSVMFDGSHYPLKENIRLTKKVVDAAHAVGVSVEGELGTISSTEDDMTIDEANGTIVDPVEAVYFWKETQVDALAIAVGTAHGLYKKAPHIHTDVIKKVFDATGVPIVLHGGSGVPDSSIREAINAGVAKINVNTESLVAFSEAVRKSLACDETLFDPRQYLSVGKDAAKEIVRNKIRLFGSQNKANYHEDATSIVSFI